MKYKILIYPFLFITLSCANFVNKIDDDLLSQKSIPYKKDSNSKTYCEESQDNITLVSENSKDQKIFLDYIKKYKFSFAEQMVLWTFVQMIERPDLSSPGAKFQILIHYGGQDKYHYFYSKDESKSYPLLYGLDYILKKYKGTKSLIQLARHFDQFYPNLFYVSDDFANFLNQNYNKISQNSSFNKFYSRADEPLRKGERISKQPLSPFVQNFYNTRRKIEYKMSDYLFNYKRNNLINTACNYDMSLYSSSIYLIQDKMIKSNTYGLKAKNNRFLALTTQNIDQFASLGNSGFFQTNNTSAAPVMCKFKSPLSDDKDIWLSSTDSRDPGQHLYHLIEYGLHSVNSVEEMDTIIRFSRHLFLKNPIRLILESERSSEGQLSELLKLNMPIYNSGKLGKIWAFYRFKDKDHFIIDDRRSGVISCQKNE